MCILPATDRLLAPIPMRLRRRILVPHSYGDRVSGAPSRVPALISVVTFPVFPGNPYGGGTRCFFSGGDRWLSCCRSCSFQRLHLRKPLSRVLSATRPAQSCRESRLKQQVQS